MLHDWSGCRDQCRNRSESSSGNGVTWHGLAELLPLNEANSLDCIRLKRVYQFVHAHAVIRWILNKTEQDSTGKFMFKPEWDHVTEDVSLKTGCSFSAKGIYDEPSMLRLAIKIYQLPSSFDISLLVALAPRNRQSVGSRTPPARVLTIRC